MELRAGAAGDLDMPVKQGDQEIRVDEGPIIAPARGAPRLAAMADYYLVEQAKGPAWDHSKPRREQAGWDAHAVFMDALVEEGVVVLGGPIGEGDGENSLLVVDADGEAAIRARLAEDPWADDLLTIEREAVVGVAAGEVRAAASPSGILTGRGGRTSFG